MEKYGDKAINSLIERIDRLLMQTDDDDRLRELARADREGHVVVYDTREEALRSAENG